MASKYRAATTKKTILFYFTNAYPYGNGEQFIVEEIFGLAKKYDTIAILPASKPTDTVRAIPENAVLLGVIYENVNGSRASITKHLFTIFSVFLGEFIHGKKPFFVLKKWRMILSFIRQGIATGDAVIDVVNKFDAEEKSFYSTWMDTNTLALALLKKRGLIKGFSFKMRGYDLFDERREGNYMPFRYFNFKHAKVALTMSKDGRDYLRKKDIYPQKVFHNYPGIQGNKQTRIKEGVMTLVSCSNMAILKRNSAIAKALKDIEFPVRWVHFGDGEEMSEVSEIIGQLPDHISVELKGNCSNSDIMNFYAEEKIDAFIHVSSTEGFGYAIIEAYCSGIPAILYPAGGVIELINSEFAVKIGEDFSVDAITEGIRKFRQNLYLKEEPREAAYQFFLKNFQTQETIDELYGYIES